MSRAGIIKVIKDFDDKEKDVWVNVRMISEKLTLNPCTIAGTLRKMRKWGDVYHKYGPYNKYWYQYKDT